MQGMVQITVRMPEPLHRAAARAAKRQGVSVNRFVRLLIEARITQEQAPREGG